jgi:hypothetical protein
MTDPHDIEALAAAEHKSWSGWMLYMLQRIEREMLERAETDAELVDAFDRLNDLACVKRWVRQMNTPYADLPEKEKESDRKEAREKLEVYRAPLPPAPPHYLTELELNKTRAWKVAERIAREEGLELHSDASDYPILVVPKTYHPVRPHDGPVPGQSAPRHAAPCPDCRSPSMSYGTCHSCGRKWGVCNPKTIVVNGVEKKVHVDELSYEEVAFMAGETGVVSMTYVRAAGDRPGMLLPGQKVKIRNGTVFNACRTDSA